MHDKSLVTVDSDIYVSGFLGDAALGLEIKKNRKIRNSINSSTKEYFLKKLFLPEPQIELGESLLGLADFCTDISDGLGGELSKICEYSNLQANIFLPKIPISNRAKKFFRIIKTKEKDMWNKILFGGEDYNLLFSIKREKQAFLRKKLKNVYRIGSFKRGKGICFLDEKKTKIDFKNIGFSHF